MADNIEIHFALEQGTITAIGDLVGMLNLAAEDIQGLYDQKAAEDEDWTETENANGVVAWIESITQAAFDLEALDHSVPE